MPLQYDGEYVKMIWSGFAKVDRQQPASREKKNSINNMLCYNIMLNDAIWSLCIETLNYCVAICFKYFKMFPNVRVSNKMSS